MEVLACNGYLLLSHNKKHKVVQGQALETCSNGRKRKRPHCNAGALSPSAYVQLCFLSPQSDLECALNVYLVVQTGWRRWGLLLTLRDCTKSTAALSSR